MGIKDDEIDVTTDEVLPEEEVTEEEEVVEESNTSEESDPAIIQDEDDDEEDRVITIGDSEPEPEGEEEEQPDKSELVKKLRKVSRGLEKKNKALQKQIEANKKATEIEKPVELGEKPTLASCKYDDEKFAQEIVAYTERKRKVEEQAKQKAEEAENQSKAWKSRQDHYVEKKKEHNFKDFADAEDIVSSTFSQTQQGIIIQGAEDSALLVYALGKNPKKLEELSKVKDPVLFAFKVAKLEDQLKVTSKKAPKPEKRVSSGKSGGVSGNGDATLKRLRDEAAVTNDYSKVTAYKKKLKG